MSLRNNIEAVAARLLRPLRLRVDGMIARAIVTAVNAAGSRQLLQLSVLDGEARDDVELMEPYGFTARPKTGADAILLAVGGHRAHSVVVVAGDRRYRLAGLAAGEVALYDDQGQKVVLYRNRAEVEAPTIVLKSASVKLGTGADAPAVRATELLTWLQTHTHPHPLGPATATPLPTTGIASTTTTVK